MWASYSSLKYLIVVRTGLGAVCPSPQSDPSLTFLAKSSRRSMSPSLPSPLVMRVSSSSMRVVPIRQCMHFPQDSFFVKSRKKRVTSTMHVVSSNPPLPPDPTIAPVLFMDAYSIGVSKSDSGRQPPDGPPS